MGKFARRRAYDGASAAMARARVLGGAGQAVKASDEISVAQHALAQKDAREFLAPVYGWFTEGLDTRDLKEAKALLDALAA
jgi:predicted ATPase